jgi:hypothetical protein
MNKRASLTSSQRKGRLVALILFYTMVVVFVAGIALQLTIQVLSPKPSTDNASCEQGLVRLIEAVEAARVASEGAEDAPEVAIARFRQALSPAWENHTQIAQRCQSANSPDLKTALDIVERLRYAEENAVRRDARDLGRLRHKVRLLREGPLRVHVTPKPIP